MPLRTSATTSESLCARAPCGDVTRGGGIPSVPIGQYAEIVFGVDNIVRVDGPSYGQRSLQGVAVIFGPLRQHLLPSSYQAMPAC
jgi:hypothetical protein